MKALKTILLAAVAAIVWTACSDTKTKYVDLNTGKTVELVKDEKTGLWVSAETGKPVTIYVDTQSNDTIWGVSGKVINGDVRKQDDGTFVYIHSDDYKVKTDEDGSSKVKDGDYKKKVDEDGDIKIKDGDKKVKIDGETGEKKVKKD